MTFDEHPAASVGEREALEFLRKGRRLRGLSPMQFQRIEHRLAHSSRPHRRKIWLPALAALAVALLAGTALGHVVDLSRLPLVGSLFPSHEPNPAQQTHRPRPQPAAGPSRDPHPSAPSAPERPPAASTPPAERAEPRPAPSPSAASAATTSRGARSASAAGRSVSLASPRGPGRMTGARAPGAFREEAAEPRPRSAPEDPISAESRSFSAALAQWHRDHNAGAALAALDQHERRFPRGQIRLEAKLLRAEIFLQQGRERESLALLDGVSLSGLPRGRELRTVRGELRVKYGRCPEGRRDLEHVLAKDGADALGRRAAHAISLCP
jgi:hypothetical protein